MKKIVALLLALSMLFALTACEENDENTPAGESTGTTTTATQSTNNATDATEDETQGTTEGTTGGDATDPTQQSTTTPPTTTPPTTTPPTTRARYTHRYSAKATTDATRGTVINDTDSPITTILSISPNPAQLGNEVTIKVRVTDESGVQSVTVQLINSAGSMAGGNLSRIEGDAKNGVYEGTFTLPATTPAGDWRASVYTRDIHGNLSDLTNQNFTVNGDIDDADSPVTTILSISPNPAQVGGEVTIKVRVTDESGIQSVTVQLINSAGTMAGGNLSRIEGDAKNGVYEGTFTLPANTPAGDWRASVYTRDIYGNLSGLTNQNFTVKGDINDTDSPVTTFLSISPDPAKLGKEVTIKVRITDESGVQSVMVQIMNSTGTVAGGNLSRVEGDAKNGVYEGTFTLPATTPVGDWCASVYTRDIYGNLSGLTNQNFTVIAS